LADNKTVLLTRIVNILFRNLFVSHNITAFHVLFFYSWDRRM